jgi:hypothetical protein
VSKHLLAVCRRTIITRAGNRFICFGEGHGFSRAVRAKNDAGFSP